MNSQHRLTFFFPVLIVVFLLIPQVFTVLAQDEPDEPPNADASIPTILIEPQANDPEALEPIMTEPGPGSLTRHNILTGQFDGLAEGWVFSENTSLFNYGPGNAAVLPPGETIYPANTLMLLNQHIETRANIMTPTSGDVADGLSVFFRIGDDGLSYLLAVETSRTTLYKGSGQDYNVLTFADANRELNTWFTLQIEVEGGNISVWVDGQLELTYADEDPLQTGQLAFFANGSSIMLDDIIISTTGSYAPQAITSTMVPNALDETIRNKFGGAFLSILDLYLRGNEAAAYAMADDYFMDYDDRGFHLVVWGADGVTGNTVAELVAAAGGTNGIVGSQYVEAHIPLESVLDVATADTITAISLPELIISTSAHNQTGGFIPFAGTGAVLPHSLDLTGASSWHTAGYTGSGVNIAIIDSGFDNVNDAAAANERTCKANDNTDGGSGSHGTGIVELLCDIAPSASVYMYSASTATQLTAKIAEAANLNGAANPRGFPKADIILVTMDPGASTEFTANVNAAVAANVVVVAAAGNGAGGGVFSFKFENMETTIPIQASSGSVISYNWESDATYPTQLSLDGVVIDTRASSGSSSHQYRVPASCGESCTLDLTIQGDVPTHFTVRVSDNDKNNQIDAPANITPQASGSLTELASMANVISVGAVCPLQGDDGAAKRYQLLPNSAIGAAGQQNNANIKPSLVAPSRVSTSLSAAGDECTGGLDGTSAAAAHIAGMSALLMSNPNMQGIYNTTVGVPAVVKNYFQARSIDLSISGTPDGYDNSFGAGLAQLGNPNFNLGNQQIVMAPASNVGGTAYYVGTRAVPLTGEPDGTVTNPFTHPAFAVSQAITNGVANVVFLPGEFVSSFEITDPGATGLNIVSYNSVDTINWFPSTYWVNDTFNKSAGISIQHAGTNSPIKIEGLEFYGASPLYADLLPGGNLPASQRVGDIVALVITSDNVTISNNLFYDFDGPISIPSAENITITGNTFEKFKVVTELQSVGGGNPEPIALYDTAVLKISDSGQTTPITVFGNTFKDNTLPLGPGVTNSAWQDTIVGILRSQVDLFNNRFAGNTAESVISINQWKNGQEKAGIPQASDIDDFPVTLFGSWFDANNVSKSLIQMYQIPRFRFMNNTVSRHDIADTEVGNILTLGYNGVDRLNYVNHRWELHNNVFHANQVRGNLIAGGFDDPLGTNGCLPIGASVPATPSPLTNNAARNNWFSPAFTFGECAVSIGTFTPFTDSNNAPQNNNVFINAFNGVALLPPSGATQETIIQSQQAMKAFEAENFFTELNDPNNPFRLRPTISELIDPPPPNVTYNPGVDTGDTAAAMAVPRVPTTDLFGIPRFIDRPPTTGADIDMGAYELGDPTPIVFDSTGGNYFIEVPEDSLVTIQLKDHISGGFEPYVYQFSNVPTVYDTNPLSPCGGAPFLVDRFTGVFTYCPPPDFYNAGLTTTNPTTEIRFNYEAFGLLAATGSGTGQATIHIKITSVDETDPLLTTAPTIDLAANPSSELIYHLRPNARFDFSGQFVLSDPDPSIFVDSPDVDFPFTYSPLSVDTSASLFNPLIFDESYPSDPQNLSQAQIDAINLQLNTAVQGMTFTMFSSGGLIPVANQSGAFEFTYNVTDNDGDSGQRRVRVRIPGQPPGQPGDSDGPGSGGDGDTTGPGDVGPTSTIPHVGLYDEASLIFQLPDWTPFYYQPAINETIHYTTAANQVGKVSFTGDAFALHLLGYKNGGTYTLEIDHNDDGNFSSYETLGLACTNGSTTPTLSTVKSEIMFFTFGCSGLDQLSKDSLRTLRITSATASPIILDAIEIRGTSLKPGLYQDGDFALKYDTSWQQYVIPGTNGDTLTFSETAGATVSFNVDGDLVDTLVIYRATGPRFGPLQVSFNGNPARTINNAENDKVLMLNRAIAIPGIGDGTVTVTIAGTTAEYFSIEAIALLGPGSVLDPGYYSMNEPRLLTLGNWVSFGDTKVLPNLRTGHLYFNTAVDGGAITFSVDATQSDTLVLHYDVASFWGRIQVCGTICATEIVLNSDGETPFKVIPLADIGVSGESGMVAINVLEGYAGIEGIQLVAIGETLNPGYYDAYRDQFDIAYTDNWTPAFDSRARESTYMSASDSTAKATFTVKADTTGLVIYGAGNMEVCADDGSQACTTINGTGFGSKTYIDRGTLGLDATDAVISISPSSQIMLLEGIHVVGNTPDSGFESLPDGRSPANTNKLRYIGIWSSITVPDTVANQIVYSFDPTAGGLFEIEGNGITLYYTSGFNSGAFEICIDVTKCTTVAADNAQVISWGRPVTLLSDTPGGKHIVEIRSLDTGWLGIEAIDVVGSTPSKLAPGFYSDYDPGLRYSGGWTQLANAVAESGTLRLGNASAELNFDVDTTEAGTVAIHYPAASTGMFAFCIDADCANVTQDASGIATRSFAAAAGGAVKITAQSDLVLIDSIEITGRTGTLQPGYYDENDGRFSYSGPWTQVVSPVYKGNAILFTDSSTPANVTFNVNATAGSSIAVHHPAGAAWGTMRICGTGSNCQNIDMAANIPAGRIANVTTVDMAKLGLSGTTAQVTISCVSGYIALDGVEVVSSTQGLAPGSYKHDAANLTYTGNWLTYDDAATALSIAYTVEPNATLSFTIGGGVKGTDPGVAGFAVQLLSYPGGADYDLCYTRQSTGAPPVCIKQSLVNNSIDQILPLAPLTPDLSTNETYTVTITHTGTSGQGLIIDSVTVYGDPTTTLTINADGSPGLYDDTYPGITYAPENQWISGGAVPSLYKGTYTYTSNELAVMKFRITGNAVTLYQVPFDQGTTNTQYCVITGTDSSRGRQCNTYSLSNPTGAVIPSAITLYGFGFGTHDLFIRNLSLNKILLLDALQVR